MNILIAVAFFHIVGTEVVEAPNNTDRISNFPAYLETLTEARRNEMGYYSQVEEREGIGSPFVESGKIIIPEKTIEPISPMVKTYNVSDIIYGLVGIGKWEAIRVWLNSQGLLDAFVASGTMSDDFPGWSVYIADACRIAGITDAERDAILKNAEVLGR